MKSGFVSLIGRPNVGKSTLLNNILGKKVVIISNKPQTTRNNIQGIYNDEDCQIVFVDTPGIHKPRHKLGVVLNKQAFYTFNNVDILLFLVDGSVPLGPGDKFIIEKLKNVSIPVFLIINKIDKITKDEVLNKIAEYKDLYNFSEIIPLSAIKDGNVLVDVLKQYLPDNIKYYPDDLITNKPVEFLITELIREKVFNLTEEEIPHSITCVIESIEKSKGSFFIRALIIVDRDSLKKIIIGKRGQMIKEIGIQAREDIEKLLKANVYLELFVKTKKKWREKGNLLTEFGYTDFE